MILPTLLLLVAGWLPVEPVDQTDLDSLFPYDHRVEASINLAHPSHRFLTTSEFELLAQTGRITFQRGASGGVGFQSAPKVEPKSYHDTRPLFGTSAANAARSSGASRYRVPPPLITSREVARASVWQSLVGSRWYW